MTLERLIATAYGESTSRVRRTPANPSAEPLQARLIAREDLVLAGLDVFEAAIRFLDPAATFGWQFRAGDLVLAGQAPCWIKGDPAGLLAAERVALELMGRACGIATLTRCYVGETSGTPTGIVNARFTTPGLREFEAHAVRAGGGHSPDELDSPTLYLTLNQALAAGSLARALQLLRTEHKGPVTVECASLDDVDAAVEARVARVVLVGLAGEDVAAARARVPRRIRLEAGGALSMAEARRLAAAGVDFVRVDQLTSSAPRADLHLVL